MYWDACQDTCVEVRGQLAEAGCLPLPCGFWELSSGRQTWQQTLAFTHEAFSPTQKPSFNAKLQSFGDQNKLE